MKIVNKIVFFPNSVFYKLKNHRTLKILPRPNILALH